MHQHGIWATSHEIADDEKDDCYCDFSYHSVLLCVVIIYSIGVLGGLLLNWVVRGLSLNLGWGMGAGIKDTRPILVKVSFFLLGGLWGDS